LAVVRAAAAALGACEHVPDVQPLKRLLHASDKELRVEAAVALTRVGSSSGPAALERLSYDSEEAVRHHVVTAIGQLGDAHHAPILIRLLDDTPSVRRAVLEVLPKIADNPPPGSAGRSPESMAQLWKDWHLRQNVAR
jgi:HEAT repeat protein